MTGSIDHPKLHLLRRQEIETDWWDHHISTSSFPIAYAMSWYLDILAPGWMALVSDDKKWVMPLPVNRKLFGFRQVYMPYLIQQLGIFGAAMPDIATIDRFLKKVARHFISVTYCLNESNPAPSASTLSQAYTNTLLSLTSPYDQIKSAYSRSVQRRLKTAHTYSYAEQHTCSVSDFITRYRLALQDKIKGKHIPWGRFADMISAANAQGKGNFYRVLNQSDDTLLAEGFFLKQHNRIINLIGFSTERGRDKFGMHVLLDHVIQQHAGQSMIFDFEGSSIPGVAEFFLQFGSYTVPYYRIKTGLRVGK